MWILIFLTQDQELWQGVQLKLQAKWMSHHSVKKTMEDNETDNDFEEDTLRGVSKLNKTILV